MWQLIMLYCIAHGILYTPAPCPCRGPGPGRAPGGGSGAATPEKNFLPTFSRDHRKREKSMKKEKSDFVEPENLEASKLGKKGFGWVLLYDEKRDYSQDCNKFFTR